MTQHPRLTAAQNVDMESHFLYRYISGANDIYYPHSHDYYEFFLTLSGIVTHEINGITQKLPEGSLTFIRPDDVHGYIYDDPKSSNTAYINVTFTRQTAADLFFYLSDAFPAASLLQSAMPPSVLLSPTEKQRLFLQLQDLNAAKWEDKQTLKLRMRVILADILVRYFSNLPNHAAPNVPIWLSQVMTDMEQQENFTAGSARMVQLSKRTREHVSRCMQKFCGMTITQYINSLRINYACNLLINTNIPILDICYQCGFQNVSYFYRAFKEATKLSPKDFRLTHQF